ncbi:MAG TPA: glycoside hydrolase family 66 protein, partial [Ktedonobacteraceae bacterium]
MMQQETETHQVELCDLWSDRASYKPGEAATIHLLLKNTRETPQTFALTAHLSWLNEKITEQRQQLEFATEVHEVKFVFALPHESFRGYGIDVRVYRDDGTLCAQRSIGLDVLEHWTQAPRYGFLADFLPECHDAITNVAALARYHINIVQFYDWMWRHYALMPPEEVFRDGCGRIVSLQAVREKVAACRTQGMAALGYAAVYGAEPEYALEHPDEMLYNEHGTPYSLGNLFYIMNIHQGNPWRPRILATMADAVREVPFDGLHLDQYGFPRERVFGPAPNNIQYDLAEDFPPFIDDARTAIRQAVPDSCVIFNAVENWPIEAVAPTTQDSTYIEVWPPYESYHDLQKLILEARQLAPDKQIILASYMKPLQGAEGDTLLQAEAATLLASATIWANGGFHLLMGERDAALCDPYYPSYATLRPAFAEILRRYYDFVVRYENVLSDLKLVTLSHASNQWSVQLPGRAMSTSGEANTIWTITRTMPELYTIAFINLSNATDALWNACKSPASPLRDIAVEIQVEAKV